MAQEHQAQDAPYRRLAGSIQSQQITLVSHKERGKDAVYSLRTLVPYAGSSPGVKVYAAQMAQSGDKPVPHVYAVAGSQEEANQLPQDDVRQSVTVAERELLRYRRNSVNLLWFQPPPDRGDGNAPTPEAVRQELERAITTLAEGATLVCIAAPELIAGLADLIVPNCTEFSINRLPGMEPETAALRALCRRLFAPANAGGRYQENRDAYLKMASAPEELPAAEIPPEARSTPMIQMPDRSLPVYRIENDAAQRAELARNEGGWRNPAVRKLFDHRPQTRNVRPIEKIPDGHTAVLAASSMLDRMALHDPNGIRNPIVIRGFFNKEPRSTFTAEGVKKNTEFYEHNILALDTVTGAISQVGKSAAGLESFMKTFGPSIRAKIDELYPPTIDVNSPEYQAVGTVIDAIPRPLIGKQRHVAIAGALHLQRERHLNLFAKQGSGKTCTAAGIARGLRARVIAVTTPARVIPNWIAEIRAVCPQAIIRVVQDRESIGQRRELNPLEKSLPPAPFGRASLEAIRLLDPWATPETPLWVLMKKDAARTQTPRQPALRAVNEPEAVAQELRRPLEQLAAAERRAGAKPMPVRAGTVSARPKLLYRKNDGRLASIARDLGTASRQRNYDPERPTYTCPRCWSILYNGPQYGKPLPNSKKQLYCDSRRQWPKFPRLWEASRSQPAAEPPALESCQAPLKVLSRDRHGKARYAYGRYYADRMARWADVYIMDESQDYKARDSLQGIITRRIAQKSRRTIALTGTPFGGRVSELFHPLVAFHPQFAREYSYHESAEFLREYGRQEFTLTSIQKAGLSYTERSTRQIPGYHPKILLHYWPNTIFMSLDDVDVRGALPSFTQHAQLLELDGEIQSSGYSQQSAYESLDTALTGHMRATIRRQQGKKRINNYIQEMLTCPENAWQGIDVRHPDSGQIIHRIPPLDPTWLYPKEIELTNIIERQRSLGRKCLVYCTHTGARDTTARLVRIIKDEGFRVIRMDKDIDQEARAQWLQEAAQGHDVIVCHPRLVETGVNLTEYPTIIWYEIDHSMITTEQASARSYRLNQTRPVEVYFLAYANTMQEQALQLIAQKSDVSRTFQGELSRSGLSAFNPVADDIREDIARALLQSEYDRTRQGLPTTASVQALNRLFEQTNVLAGESFYHPAPLSPAPEKPARRQARTPEPSRLDQPALGI